VLPIHPELLLHQLEGKPATHLEVLARRQLIQLLLQRLHREGVALLEDVAALLGVRPLTLGLPRRWCMWQQAAARATFTKTGKGNKKSCF
jgi:hypothetical protein